MELEVLKFATTQGFFATLFVSLLFYVLKENARRELKYQEIIEKFSFKLETIEAGICRIDKKISKIKED